MKYRLHCQKSGRFWDRARPDGHGYICRSCERVTPEHLPNPRDRREARQRGEAWCRECLAWLPADDVNKQGLCGEHQRAADRARYAADPEHRERRLAHSSSRKRGVARVPSEARELMLELFEGGCAYCDQQAETWDHVVPVSKGGTTEPRNIVPACIACNSSKRDRDLDEWLSATGRQMSVRAIEHLAHHGAFDG
ncbi:HNH endonuclease [Rhodobacter sp. NSM]|uniref:HNH endonuclease n=1 Tax=Rhodobacter sp. NSM TaxID=3457501 RepID=UPI003FD32263